MQERNFDVLVAGEINPDLILSGGDVTPAFGQVEKMVERADLTVGSSSAIFACGAARLGLRVVFAGKVGDDEFGRFMLGAMEARGVDCRGVITDACTSTGLSVILVRGADRAILTFPGSIPLLRFNEIDPALVADARHVHVASYYIQHALRPDVPRLFDLAHRHGATTSLDTNYDPKEKWGDGLAEALARTDIFLPNATECMGVSRALGLPAATCEEAIACLMRRTGTVVVKMGADGAAARRGSQTARTAAYPVPVADTVGAGDSFDAGFVYAHLAGWELPRALRFAAVCGSLSTRQPGGTSAQPTLEEALEWMQALE